MPQGVPVTPATFAGVQNVDIDGLSMLPESELRPILPCLVRMSLCAPLDASVIWTQERKKILKCLSGIEIVNSLVGLLSIDFHELEQDARKELQLRAKLGGNPTESLVIAALPQGIALEFERCDAARKLRLLLSELLFIMYQMKQLRSEFYQKKSELFESEVYLEEVSDVLCIAQAELPSLLPMNEITDVLLHIRNGAWLLCRVVANAPDSFQEVCARLVANGDEQDEETLNGQRRTSALIMLCAMCPSYSLTVRSLCVTHCRQPSVAVKLTILHEHQLSVTNKSDSTSISELVSFVSGLLLDNDSNVRNWFSQYIRTGLKKKDSGSSVAELRQKLLDELKYLLVTANPKLTIHKLAEGAVIRGCAAIRLYSALKCIAGLKFTDDENQTLLKLITCRAPPSRAGIRFASLGLCMLLACPNIISNSDQKAMAVDWIQWLVKEAEHFEMMSGVRASFGGMLLLIAIHFHSSQTNAINDLVSATLGMKSSLKTNALAYMKTVFTQEIFNEQVVTAHAVKVAVTEDLNAEVNGYLPVHCMYHLLRSRTFAKHQVRITDWIYRQLCHCTSPIHPVIPSLIEAFVASIIVPATRTDCTNEPIPQDELLVVFQDPFSSETTGGANSRVEDGKNTSFTTHILLVYYLLLYEDTLLNNMASIVSWNRKVHHYSAQLMARLPIKYVLQQSQKQPLLYACIYQPLLRLVATHYPHHCLIGDWLNEEMVDRLQASLTLLSMPSASCPVEELSQAFLQLPSNSGQCVSLMDPLVTKSSVDLMSYRNVLVGNLFRLLEVGVSRHCQDLVQHIWLKMNGLYSMNLRSQTVNALRRRHSDWSVCSTKDNYTTDDIVQDPLIVLRCDERVFRCPPLMEITLGNLEAFLQASRSSLTKHMQVNPVSDKIGQAQSSDDREKLRLALVAAQESAAVQILLECCLPRDDTEKNASGLLSDLREIQGIVCSHLHQMFIADPGLAKLVHFQGYPRELLQLTVAGIPSMHICLDFISELIAQPQLDKQIFAIDLISYLSLQYALPKSLGVAKLAVNVMSTMLGVLSNDTLPVFFVATLPSLVRICRAFPPLCDDSVTLLIRLGRTVHSHLSTLTGTDIGFLINDGDKDIESAYDSKVNTSYASLYSIIFRTFAEIVGSTTLLRHQLQ